MPCKAKKQRKGKPKVAKKLANKDARKRKETSYA